MTLASAVVGVELEFVEEGMVTRFAAAVVVVDVFVFVAVDVVAVPRTNLSIETELDVEEA
jgi:hypothetical protein